MPPSTATQTPVTKRASPEARNAITSAMSSGWPKPSPSGVRRLNQSRVSDGMPVVSRVAMRPGATALTRMPRGPSSAAIVSVRFLSAALVDA